jgi:hypothetical protein
MKSQSTFTLAAEDAVNPVVRRPISISPVVGSVALYYIACLISLTASSTSFFSTSVARRIFAIASDILIMDSSCLGVAVMVFFALPIFLILLYSSISVS